jgi:hypothetical protein
MESNQPAGGNKMRVKRTAESVKGIEIPESMMHGVLAKKQPTGQANIFLVKWDGDMSETIILKSDIIFCIGL